MRFTRFAMVTATVFAIALTACSSSDGAEGGGGASNGGLGWTRVSPTELQQMLEQEDVYLVNVHVPYEGDIPSTDASISYAEIASRVDELPTNGDRSSSSTAGAATCRRRRLRISWTPV
jgi:hypothetical protein